jgi:hypothetical protein
VDEFDFRGDRDIDDLGADGAAALARPAALNNSYTVSFKGTLYVPGVLHVLHNCTKDLKLQLTEWRWFTERLACLARLVGRPWSRDRLLATCFRDAPHKHSAHLFSVGHHSVYEERWAETLKVIDEFKILGPPLRAAWNLRAFTFGQGNADRDQHVNIVICDEAILDPVFWGYLEMVGTVGQVVESCVAWAESCPCHHQSGSFAPVLPGPIFGHCHEPCSWKFRTLGLHRLAARRVSERSRVRLLSGILLTSIRGPALSRSPDLQE